MKTGKRERVIKPQTVRNGLFDKVIPPVLTPEVQEAWNIVAEYLAKHEEVSFFIDPWTGKDNRFNIHTFTKNNGSIVLLKANTKWAKPGIF